MSTGSQSSAERRFYITIAVQSTRAPRYTLIARRPSSLPPSLSPTYALFARSVCVAVEVCLCTRQGEARLVSASVCVCVCARRVTCARASPLPRKSIQISNNGSTLHCRSRRRHQRSAICIFFSSFSCTLVLPLPLAGPLLSFALSFMTLLL